MKIKTKLEDLLKTGWFDTGKTLAGYKILQNKEIINEKLMYDIMNKKVHLIYEFNIREGDKHKYDD